MNTTVYLKDGTKASLITKTDKGYVVDPYQVYNDFDSKEEYEETSGNVIMVDKVYESAPKDVIETEYKQALMKLEELRGALSTVQHGCQKAERELEALKRQKTDLSKLIINREELKNAKRLTVWIKGRIAPRTMDGNNRLKLTIAYSISQYGSEEKCWSYKCLDDEDERWSSYSENFDPEYGIKADLTDEEILKITLDRQAKHEFKGDIESADDKWLTPENIQIKQNLIEQSRRNQLARAEAELKKAQETYERLAGLVTA